MLLRIDASNILSGGGLTHLKELIKHAEPEKYGFDEVVLWAPNKTLKQIVEKPWLDKKSHPYINKGYLHRFLWKYFVLKPSLDEDALLFIPGTGYVSGAGKVVAMCQNLLPLEKQELDRFYPSSTWLRLMILRFLHIKTFSKADGIIFLNEYCSSKADALIDEMNSCVIIPHGVNNDFRLSRNSYAFKDSFDLLYVSTLDLYKHQWVIAEAVLELRKQNIPVCLTLIGEAYSGTEKKLNDVLSKYPKESQFVNWLGKVNYDCLPEYYQEADAFIYGSTCETFGMTLLEAMASSLPIACSNKSSMQNMLGDAGVYFNPEDVESIQNAVLTLYKDKNIRNEKGKKAHSIALNYSWEKTADQTFQYLSQIAES
ncbi:MAG: glycosyltransferase family 1 protein [Balneolaceae bacterium]|nr:glycosyltransferase family 1 protein [Balneolaceae bacterium]